MIEANDNENDIYFQLLVDGSWKYSGYTATPLAYCGWHPRQPYVVPGDEPAEITTQVTVEFDGGICGGVLYLGPDDVDRLISRLQAAVDQARKNARVQSDSKDEDWTI